MNRSQEKRSLRLFSHIYLGALIEKFEIRAYRTYIMYRKCHSNHIRE